MYWTFQATTLYVIHLVCFKSKATVVQKYCLRLRNHNCQQQFHDTACSLPSYIMTAHTEIQVLLSQFWYVRLQRKLVQLQVSADPLLRLSSQSTSRKHPTAHTSELLAKTVSKIYYFFSWF